MVVVVVAVTREAHAAACVSGGLRVSPLASQKITRLDILADVGVPGGASRKFRKQIEMIYRA